MRKELLNEYVEYLKCLGKSKETIRSYKTAFNRFFNDTNFSMEDLEVTKSWCLDYANSLREEISVPTINKHMKQMSSFYQFLMVKGYVKANPFYQLPSLSNSDSPYKDKVMSDEQAKAIIKASDSFEIRTKALIYLLMNIAPRIGEVSRIRVKDIDLDNNKIWIRSKGHNDQIARYSNFNDKTKSILIDLMVAFGLDREYLFVNYKGEQLSEQSLRKMWYEVTEVANVENVTPHQVRHYVGSSLVEKGVELKKVSQILGHTGIKTTEMYYVRPKENFNETLDVIDIF
jgi:site-specific recombinase XerD